jgi:hypothetical protein
MASRDALRLIRHIASNDAVDFTEHGLEEMANDGFYRDDVVNALANSEGIISENQNRWKVYGPSVSGEGMAVITIIINENTRLRVITVHLPP